MAKVRFNLHNPKEKETHIRLVYRYPGAHGAALVRNKRILAGRPGGRSYRPIMDILGHRTERVFFRYIKVSAEQTAVEFARARRAG